MEGSPSVASALGMEDDDLAVAREGGGEEGVVEDWRRDAGHARQLAEAHGEDLQTRV